ncbi:MAG TPA: winged helix-turn-helix domain-containing protein [Terriglobales bacterium]|nr:winged helix-turn-helix domain-containing protein [Terriglobales bacterium]
MVGSQTIPQPLKLRFSAFEVDLVSRELLKHGTRVKLQRQPFEILCMLLERPGEVVSREELRERLWPENTFVEYEDSLNTAVRKLRAALSDSSELPRYIETVARQGYRFIAPVQPVVNTTLDTLEGGGELPAITKPTRKKSRLPIATLAISALLGTGLAGWWKWSHSPNPQPSAGKVMLAVLPFRNLTGDPAQEYFSDGLTEEMIMRLGGLDPQHLGVIARSSVMQYKNTQTSLEQIGRDLGVQYALEGSVRHEGERLRIAAQLIQLKDQTHMWARQYDREQTSVLAVQAEIAQEIADEIRLTLGHTPATKVSQGSMSAQEYEGYDAYLRGLYFFSKRTVPAFQQAIEAFQEAIARNPNDARAYAGLADTYTLLTGYSIAPPAAFMPRARAAALQALQLDDKLPEAHTALALISQNYDWDWQTAEKEFRRAIALNPNYATAHHWYAEHLMWRGLFDEALAESENASRLDPVSLIIEADRGAIFYYSRQYDRAIKQFRSVLEMDPYFPRANLIVEAYTEKGLFDEALSHLEKQRPISPTTWYLASLAIVHARMGHVSSARGTMDDLIRTSAGKTDPVIFGWLAGAIGDKEQAMSWLEKAYELHSSGLCSLKVEPAYDPLRSDLRFQDLLRRVGLAQ